jgi:hypothetical protein
MDAFKIIIESGYALSQNDFLELLDILQVQSKIISLHQLESITAFFMSAARMLNFDEALVQ